MRTRRAEHFLHIITSETSPEHKNGSKPAELRISFDEILEELGEMGKFQIITYILVCFPVLFGAASSMSYLFVAGDIDYRCQVPDCDNPNLPKYNEPWVSNAIPYNPIKNKVRACDMFETVDNFEELYNGTCSKNLFKNTSITCNSWVSDTKESTIQNEWNLYCGEVWKLPFVGTMHFSGIVAGSAVFGFLADTFGRKKIFIFCILLMSITGMAQVLCTDYETFLVFIFLNALGTSGVYPLAFIIGVEMVGKKRREFTGIFLNYFYAIGEAFIGCVAWWLQDWKLVQLSISAPPILFIIYWWCIPESVRWLLATKRTLEATNIINKVAKFNGVVLSESIMMSLQNEQAQNDGMKKLEGTGDGNGAWKSVKEILFSKKMIARALIIFYIWTANVFTFYGLSINSVNLGGNKYTNFMLTSLAGIPGYTIAWISIHSFGRKISLAGSLLGCAVCSVAVIFAPAGVLWLEITWYLLAKMFVTSAIGVVYIYTAELLPTIIRSGGVGTASTISRFGAMVAPFAPYIYPSYENFPMLLFATISGVASILAMLLPETLGTKLPETVKEAKKL